LREFTYEAPQSIAQAVELMNREGARALAGGTDLIPQMREGRRSVGVVVDLKHIAELTAITELADGGLSIGAAAKAATIASHPRVATDYPAIASSVRLIGSLQVQNRASLGGNICNAAPSADAVPSVLCHDARALIIGPGGRREMPLEEFATGPGRNALGQGEILAAILLPPPPPRSAAHYLRFTPRREMDIAVAGAGTWIHLDGTGRIANARIFLASVGPVPIRARSAEKSLIGAEISPELIVDAGRIAATEARPISDTRGSADYRRSLVATLTARALGACCHSVGVKVETP
jgi:CO/xanthine dehydrogenase FAD-binding subunit